MDFIFSQLLNATNYCCIKLSAGFICTDGNFPVACPAFSFPCSVPRRDCYLLPLLYFRVFFVFFFPFLIFPFSVPPFPVWKTEFCMNCHCRKLITLINDANFKDIWAAGTCNTVLIHILLSPTFCCTRKLSIHSFVLFYFTRVLNYLLSRDIFPPQHEHFRSALAILASNSCLVYEPFSLL